MKRRDVVAGIGAVIASPFVIGAQQRPVVMGLLSSLSPTTITKAVAAIYAGLKEQGFVEGQNLKTEQRWAEGHYERLPAMAKGLWI